MTIMNMVGSGGSDATIQTYSTENIGAIPLGDYGAVSTTTTTKTIDKTIAAGPLNIAYIEGGKGVVFGNTLNASSVNVTAYYKSITGIDLSAGLTEVGNILSKSCPKGKTFVGSAIIVMANYKERKNAYNEINYFYVTGSENVTFSGDDKACTWSTTTAPTTWVYDTYRYSLLGSYAYAYLTDVNIVYSD